METSSTVRLALGVVLAGLASATAPLAGQQFRTGTALVVIDVVATRADATLARDLAADDFEVFEDGRPQVIRQFQVVDLERAAAQNPDPPGVFTNAAEPGAIFALVLDEMMVDSRHTRLMRQWADRFLVEQVRPHDYVGVLRSGADSGLLLTTDHALVAPVIAQASGRRGGTDLSPVTGSQDEEVPMPGTDTPVLADFSELGLLDVIGEGRIQAERSLVTLQRVVEYLAPIPARRKAVLLFSQGVAFDLEALAREETSRTFDAMRRLLASAREGNVAIYTIDPRGLQGSQDPAIGPAPQPVTGDRGLDTLRDLATATGGRAVVSTNEIDPALGRIARENRFYYLLGYEPAEGTGPPSRVRRIEVRTRAPGVTVLHRRAYSPAAATTAASTASRTPMAAPLPVTGVAVALAPVLFPDPSGGASLAVPFELGDQLEDEVAVVYSLVAIDERGRQAGGSKGTLPALNGAARGLTRMKLDPGRYQLRLLAETEIDGRQGLAFANVEVPAPNAPSPVCGGFMLVQPEDGQPRPNVTRRFRSDRPVMVAAVVSSRSSLARTVLEFVVSAPGSQTVLVFPVRNPRSIRRGLWRVELGLPPGLPEGALELLLVADEKPVPGCRAELRVQ